MTPSDTRPARIDAQHWGWRHAGRAAWAVAGLDLHIEPGERVLLLGASGSGKSTLLHGLAGVLGGDEEGESTGALLIDGAPAAARGRAGLVAIANGYGPHDSAAFQLPCLVDGR